MYFGLSAGPLTPDLGRHWPILCGHWQPTQGTRETQGKAMQQPGHCTPLFLALSLAYEQKQTWQRSRIVVCRIARLSISHLQSPDDRRERGKRKPRLGPMSASQPPKPHQSESRDSQQARGVPGQHDGRSAARVLLRAARCPTSRQLPRRRTMATSRAKKPPPS